MEEGALKLSENKSLKKMADRSMGRYLEFLETTIKPKVVFI